MAMRRSETYKILKPIMFRSKVFKAGRIVTFSHKNAEKFVNAKQMMKVDMRGFTNVLNCGLRFPDEVVLLGSGPNGVPKYPMLKGRFIIALNGAINAPVDVNVWAAQDPLLKSEKWFNAAAMKLQSSGRIFGLNEFKRGEYPMPIIERNSIAKSYPWFKLTFTVTRPLLDPANIDVDSPLIHPGGTVCGSFIQVIRQVWLQDKLNTKPKRIILCGIDMFGNMYFNKTKHRDSTRKDKTWYRKKTLDALIKGMMDAGIEIVTVSETKLGYPKFVEEI